MLKWLIIKPHNTTYKTQTYTRSLIIYFIIHAHSSYNTSTQLRYQIISIFYRNDSRHSFSGFKTDKMRLSITLKFSKTYEYNEPMLSVTVWEWPVVREARLESDRTYYDLCLWHEWYAKLLQQIQGYHGPYFWIHDFSHFCEPPNLRWMI
jgi:hypothetical protein